MKKVFIKTFGCQMNVHDSEKMAGVLCAEGCEITRDEEQADLIIFNTCSIRQKAEQKFQSHLGKIRLMKAQRPELKVAVAGCIAQQRGKELLKRAPHVDYLIGPQNLLTVGDILKTKKLTALEDNPGLGSLEFDHIERGVADAPEKRSGISAWVSIMYGCNNFCTYCIVPYTRGREKSRSSQSIIDEVKGLAESGYKEVTLLGQNVNSYAGDMSFPELLGKLNDIDGIGRIRFVTSHPRDLSPALIEAMATYDKVCEHIHLPLQSGSDNMLQAMNRKYTFEEYYEKVLSLRDNINDIAITTDIIAGFPGETEADHEATMKAIRLVQYDGVFAFKYSPRPGTMALKLDDQLSEETKLERLTEILNAQDEITYLKNQALIGQTLEVLIEGTSETDPQRLAGKTRGNKIVNIDNVNLNINFGDIVDVIIKEAGRHSLTGEVVA